MLARAQSFSDCYGAVRTQAGQIAQSRPDLRQEHLAGIHNPWGYNAAGADPWTFLDICEHSHVVSLVQDKIGPDLILWDSELYLSPRRYEEFLAAGKEGRYWPFDPQLGAVVVIALDQSGSARCFLQRELSDAVRSGVCDPLYVIRYMSARTQFQRDARYPSNWTAMEEQVLINLPSRPLWLVHGVDHASNDFVTGFSTPAPLWSGVPALEA